MKKLLCLLLALVMVLSLAACSDSGSTSKKDKDDEEEKEEKVVELEDGIVGTWTLDITFTEEMLGMEGVNIDGIPVTFTFNEDGEVTLAFGDEAADILEEQMLDIMVDMIYQEMEAEGMTREEIDEQFESYYGMSVVDMMEEYLVEMDILSALSDLEETTDYEVDGDKLIIDDSEMTAEIKGDKLTITECDDETWEELGLELPVVMKRVD